MGGSPTAWDVARLSPPDSPLCAICQTSHDKDGHEPCEFHEECVSCCEELHCPRCGAVLNEEDGECRICEIFADHSDMANLPYGWRNEETKEEYPFYVEGCETPVFFRPLDGIPSWGNHTLPVPSIFTYDPEIHAWVGEKNNRTAHVFRRPAITRWEYRVFDSSGDLITSGETIWAPDAFEKAIEAMR